MGGDAAGAGARFVTVSPPVAGRLGLQGRASIDPQNAEWDSVWLVGKALEVHESEDMAQAARRAREQESAEDLAEDGAGLAGVFGLCRKPGPLQQKRGGREIGRAHV